MEPSTPSVLMRQRAIVKNRELAKQAREAEAEAMRRRAGATDGRGVFTAAPIDDSDSELSSGAMRMLIYSHSLPPWVDGVSTRFKSHLKLLKEEGHKVTVVTIEDQLDPQVRSSVDHVVHVDSTCLYWYPAKRFPDLTLRNLKRIWDACVRSRAQVMHCTMCPSLPLFFMCARALNIPLMVSIHTDSVTLLEKCGQPWPIVRLCGALEPLGTWFADATYTVSPSYSAILLQRGIRCLDLTWGGYANPAVFHPGRASSGDWRHKLSFGHPDDFILITAGRVSPEKNVEFLVELVRRFRSQGHRVWLAVIGDGPAAADFAPLHGSEDAGIWCIPGFLSQVELAEVYASVDVVASASTFETFGYTALEAMQCGTPFLGPRAQGFRDTVAHGKGGYLFDARDMTSAAHYLELMLQERHELFPPRQVLDSIKDFTAANCVRRTVQAYRLSAEQRRRATAKYGCAPALEEGEGAAAGGAGSGRGLVRRACMQCVRTLPALLMVFFIGLNWCLLHAPLLACWAAKQLARARRTAGATWDRSMRLTNLTRNRVLVGTQVTK